MILDFELYCLDINMLLKPVIVLSASSLVQVPLSLFALLHSSGVVVMFASLLVISPKFLSVTDLTQLFSELCIAQLIVNFFFSVLK
jgi:hypothetical protein